MRTKQIISAFASLDEWMEGGNSSSYCKSNVHLSDSPVLAWQKPETAILPCLSSPSRDGDGLTVPLSEEEGGLGVRKTMDWAEAVFVPGWVHEVNLYFGTSRRITLLQPNSGHQFCQIRTTRTCPPVSVPIHRPFISCFMALNGTTFIICQVTDHVGLVGPPFITAGVHFSVLQTRARVHLQLAGMTFHYVENSINATIYLRNMGGPEGRSCGNLITESVFIIRNRWLDAAGRADTVLQYLFK